MIRSSTSQRVRIGHLWATRYASGYTVFAPTQGIIMEQLSFRDAVRLMRDMIREGF